MAEKTRLPRWKKGDPITAADLNALAEAIEAARVEVDSSGGLIPLQTPSGLKLSFRPRPTISYATITTDCPAFSGSTLGKGAGTLYYVAYSTTGVATIASTGTTGVAIYNGGNAAVVSGKRVQVQMIQGAWHLTTVYC